MGYVQESLSHEWRYGSGRWSLLMWVEQAILLAYGVFIALPKHPYLPTAAAQAFNEKEILKTERLNPNATENTSARFCDCTYHGRCSVPLFFLESLATDLR